MGYRQGRKPETNQKPKVKKESGNFREIIALIGNGRGSPRGCYTPRKGNLQERRGLRPKDTHRGKRKNEGLKKEKNGVPGQECRR